VRRMANSLRGNRARRAAGEGRTTDEPTRALARLDGERGSACAAGVDVACESGSRESVVGIGMARVAQLIDREGGVIGRCQVGLKLLSSRGRSATQQPRKNPGPRGAGLRSFTGILPKNYRWPRAVANQ